MLSLSRLIIYSLLTTLSPNNACYSDPISDLVSPVCDLQYQYCRETKYASSGEVVQYVDCQSVSQGKLCEQSETFVSVYLRPHTDHQTNISLTTPITLLPVLTQQLFLIIIETRPATSSDFTQLVNEGGMCDLCPGYSPLPAQHYLFSSLHFSNYSRERM